MHLNSDLRGQFHAVFQRLFMHFESVKSVAAERRNQSGMDVDDAVFIPFDKGGREDIEESRQNDQIGVQFRQLAEQRFSKGFTAVIVLAVYDMAGQTVGGVELPWSCASSRPLSFFIML